MNDNDRDAANIRVEELNRKKSLGGLNVNDEKELQELTDDLQGKVTVKGGEKKMNEDKTPEVPTGTTEENKDDGTPADLNDSDRADLEERKDTPEEGGTDATEFNKHKQ
jgi:hypothetical protein